MPLSRKTRLSFYAVILFAAAIVLWTALRGPSGPRFEVTIADGLTDASVDGRVLVILSRDSTSEPRFQTRPGYRAVQVFGVDADGLQPGRTARVDGGTFGYPKQSTADLEPGRYWAQAVLHRYETFDLATGHRVKLPMPRGAGQNFRREPGNLYSTPFWVDIGSSGTVTVTLDQVLPAIEPPEDTEYIRHLKIRSNRLSEFWGRDMFLGAHVLVPEGYDEHAEARYPLMVFHGHFPADFGGFRTDRPDPTVPCVYSERFRLDCYNRIEDQEAYEFYRTWTSRDFPRFLVVEIQHDNPYYDDSYAVNSANLGPYGDAIQYELIPEIERRFRGIGEGWARFTYGGSTGGWEALAVQIFYPEEYNGAFGACPDPIDFRQYTQVDIYSDRNAYWREGPFHAIERPALRNWLGHVDVTQRDYNHYELALGTHARSGEQFDIWQAVYSPMGDDGYPKPIWDKLTGNIDPEVAAHWRENYDLRHILQRDWARLGPQLRGKLHIYVGDMDNYYLNNAVYLMEEFLESTTDPYYAGEIDYGDRAEHCWNGDQTQPNAISRLRYNTMYVPRILRRIEATAPPGADLTSWRY